MVGIQRVETKLLYLCGQIIHVKVALAKEYSRLDSQSCNYSFWLTYEGEAESFNAVGTLRGYQKTDLRVQ